MSKQLVHVAIQTNLHLSIVAPCNLFIKFIQKVWSATQLPWKEHGKSLKFMKNLKGVRLNGGI